MSEYISREAALEVFCRWCGVCPKEKQKPLECDDILGNVLHSLPAADVRPVVRGKWIIHKPFDSGRHNCNECIECSVCGTWFGHDCYEISNFCPNCGADIREEGERMIPVKVKKAIEVLQGYCEKHRRCDGCPLNDFCSNEKNKAPVDWLEQEASNETTDR